MLSVAIEMRGSHWLWVTDLSQPESLAIHLLPIMLVVTQFAMQRMTPQPGVDPAQAKMMMFMPLMFWLHVLLRVGRIGTILVNRQRGGYRAAVALEQDHACCACNRAGSNQEGQEINFGPKEIYGG